MGVSRTWLLTTCVSGLLIIGGFLGAAYLLTPGKQFAPALPALNVDPLAVSVAGNSSGGFMAVQTGVAYSASFQGIAVIGGGPYFCSEGNAGIGRRCVGQKTAGIPVDRLAGLARTWANEGRIDPVANLARQKIYVFRGTLDSVVPQEAAQSIIDFHRHFDASARIVSNFKVAVAHAWVSPYGSDSCLNESEHYINKCGDTDVAAEFLTYFYGKLQPKNEAQLSGKLIEFDQNEFFDDKNAPAHSANDFGFAYIPAACGRLERCRAVVALHGCLQDHDKVDKTFVMRSGLNQWADTNHIVVVYPQVKALNLTNQFGCWDTVGYDGPDFAWKSGSQVKMLKRIVDRITSKYPGAQQ